MGWWCSSVVSAFAHYIPTAPLNCDQPQMSPDIAKYTQGKEPKPLLAEKLWSKDNIPDKKASQC